MLSRAFPIIFAIFALPALAQASERVACTGGQAAFAIGFSYYSCDEGISIHIPSIGLQVGASGSAAVRLECDDEFPESGWYNGYSVKSPVASYISLTETGCRVAGLQFGPILDFSSYALIGIGIDE